MTTSTPDARAAWNRVAAGYDEVVTPTNMRLAERALRRAGLRPGTRFLDVAAGSGALSLPAARLGARVLATDLSPGMLARLEARARREELALETRVMDGQALELDDGSFDVAGSQFGVMLFPDMPRGLREMARATTPGGRVLVIAFGPPERVEFFGCFVAALRAVVPGFGGPESPPLAFQLADPERLSRELADAGLGDIRVETVTYELTFDSGEELWSWLESSNPVVEAMLGELGVTGEQRAALRRALDDTIRERAGGGGSAVLRHDVHIGIGTR